MEIDKIIKLLKSNKYIENVVYEDFSDGNFNRYILFTIRGVDYKIEWWVNQCYLHIGEFQMLFDTIDIDGCWPNRFKNNLNFMSDKQPVAIIPIEEYSK